MDTENIITICGGGGTRSISLFKMSPQIKNNWEPLCKELTSKMTQWPAAEEAAHQARKDKAPNLPAGESQA